MQKHLKTILGVSVIILALILSQIPLGDTKAAADDAQTAATVTYTVKDGVLTKYAGNDTTVTIPPCVTSIGSSAFKGNTSLKTVIVPSSVISIGASAFSGCTSLTNATIAESVLTIGDKVFENCHKDLTLTSTAGSYAKTYAKSYGFNFKETTFTIPSLTISTTKTDIPNSSLIRAAATGIAGSFILHIDNSEGTTITTALTNSGVTVEPSNLFPMSISLNQADGTAITALESCSIVIPIPKTWAKDHQHVKMVAINSAGRIEYPTYKTMTVDGTPCILFTTTHFSDYAMYLDVPATTAATVATATSTGTESTTASPTTATATTDTTAASTETTTVSASTTDAAPTTAVPPATTGTTSAGGTTAAPHVLDNTPTTGDLQSYRWIAVYTLLALGLIILFIPGKKR